MDNVEIDGLTGAALDVAVTERVLNLRIWAYDEEPDGYPYVSRMPHGDGLIYWTEGEPCGAPWSPSTDIASAWLVAEHLRGAGWVMALTVNRFMTEPWDCRMSLAERHRVIAHGTAPLAICRAALKARENTP